VVSHRSAYAALAPTDRVVILSHPTRFNRTIHLPGLRVALVNGPAALAGDTPLDEGRLHRASTERMLLENLTRPRGSEGRSLGEAAVLERLNELVAAHGADGLQAVRNRAHELARPLNMAKELARLEVLIKALLGAGSAAESGARPGQAASAEAPADAACMALMQALAARLKTESLPRQLATATEEPARTHQALLEAYSATCAGPDPVPFDQARDAVLLGRFTEPRPRALHQLLGVFRLAVHSPLCDSVPPFGAWFPQGIKARHGLMSQLDAQAHAGQFRTGVARTPATGWIEAGRIRSTLVAGSQLARGVPDGLARAIFYSVLVWRIQPFEHGSECLAHLLMNAELSSVGEARIIIPTASRSHLVDSRNQLSLGGDASQYIGALVALQRWFRGARRAARLRLQAQAASGPEPVSGGGHPDQCRR
jgi:hypothetical protein